jgi:hypothetical protein
MYFGLVGLLQTGAALSDAEGPSPGRLSVS